MNTITRFATYLGNNIGLPEASIFCKSTCWNNMDEVPHGFRPCISCTRSCYDEHWPFPNKDYFRAPSFVKTLCDSNLAAMATCWMVIPSAWLKLYGDEVGNSAILHGPSGNTWQVGVGRPKWVAFRVGWRTFAADNCLEKGDMLVFTLIGNSVFSVKIFDSRTCLEKESSLTATNTGCYDSRSPVLSGEKRKPKNDDENPSLLKRICLYENEGVHLGNNDHTLKSFRTENSSQQGPAKLSTFSLAAHISQKECALLDLNSKPLFIHQSRINDSGRGFLEANHQLLNAIDARTLHEYPSSNVYQPHPISIRSHDVKEDCDRQGLSKTEERGSGGLGPATRFASQRRPVMDATRERSAEFLYRQNNSSALITSEQNKQTLDLNTEHFAQAVNPQILSPAIIWEREKALELARRAQDMIDRPSHLVALRAFHVHGRAFVRFPVTFGKQHMPRKTVPMHLLDSNGHRWPMTWLRDNETHMGLTRGWRDFCLAEGLSEGDVCIFELIELNKLTLLIHVFRSSETRGDSQAPVTKSKRLNISHVRHVAHRKSFERRKVSEEEGRGLREEVSSDGNDQLPTKLVMYNAFHKATLPSFVRPKNGSKRHENLTTGSVGRKRLKRLSLWASKEQGCTYSSQKGFNCITDSLEGHQLEMCNKDDVELIDGDMSKAQATTYGEILCQMSSGCTNANSSTISENPSTRWVSTIAGNMELNGSNGKVHMSKMHDFEGQQFHAQNQSNKHDITNASRRLKQKGVMNSGRMTLEQWAKTRERHRRYCKGDNKRPLSWTWSTAIFSALKRRTQVSNGNPQIYLASRRTTVWKAQKKATKEAALALTTVNPAALVVMKKSNVCKTYTVELPSSFSQQLSPDGRINIFLSDAAGHKTKALLTKKALTRGWRQFSLDHLLEEGDVCVFELMDVSKLTIFVHIFRVLDINHTIGSYRHHYQIISSRIRRQGIKSNWRTRLNGQLVKEAPIKTGQLIRSTVNKSLYHALQKTRAKHRGTTTFIENKWFCCIDPLDLNLNLDPSSIPAPIANAPCASPNKTIATSCAWHNPVSKLSFEMDREPFAAKKSTCVHQLSPMFGIHPNTPGMSSLTQNNSKDICETSNVTRQQIVSQGNENVLMPFEDEDDSEPEEENYYRVVRIFKKRYFENEKQYLTELDGPVLQSDGCGGIREYDGMKWWIPEKSFSTGFASCYFH